MTFYYDLKVNITITNIIRLFLLNCSRRAHITEYYSSCRIFLSSSNNLYSYPDSDSLRILSTRMGFPHLAHGILSTFSIVFQILLIQNLHTRTLMVPLGVSLTTPLECKNLGHKDYTACTHLLY